MRKMSLSLNFVLALLFNYCMCLEFLLLLCYSRYAMWFSLVLHTIDFRRKPTDC